MPRGIVCPCCEKPNARADVWYDCTCFQGGKKSCKNCQKPAAARDAAIATVMRARGWDKNPSPGMRDYLTPGWRSPPPEDPAPLVWVMTEAEMADHLEIPF
jgi:hypothetical protein